MSRIQYPDRKSAWRLSARSVAIVIRAYFTKIEQTPTPRSPIEGKTRFREEEGTVDTGRGVGGIFLIYCVCDCICVVMTFNCNGKFCFYFILFSFGIL